MVEDTQIQEQIETQTFHSQDGHLDPFPACQEPDCVKAKQRLSLEPCPACHGTQGGWGADANQEDSWQPCGWCHGSGWAKDHVAEGTYAWLGKKGRTDD